MAKKMTQGGSKGNPRYKNGNLRRKYRARLKAMGGPCGICQGRLGEIHYDEPSNWKYPLSFVVDEIIPVSKWREYGYESPEAAAQDWNNLQAAHWCCNQAKSNKIIQSTAEGSKKPQGGRYISPETDRDKVIARVNVSDGSW